VDAPRIIHADDEPGNWMTHGRTYSEQRFSPLKKINDQNAGRLGLAWSLDLDTKRGQEATPIVVDGVMYFSTAWSKVFAVKAATGEKIWSYDPKVPPEWAINACCDVVNRGVAAWQGKIISGTLDGRLVALDAGTGKVVWETLTIDRKYRYTITGAPRVVKGKVIIGNGGAEMGVRGYVSAYDADTGKLQWRFYTVPGDPAQPFESSALERAAKTWTGRGGNSAEAEPCGKRWPTIPTSTCFTSARATGLRGASTREVPKAATIFIPVPSSRSSRTRACTFGIIRKRRATSGTLILRSTLFSPTW
jgi:PQQ-dependent dehydrogenase (methanol/ethanol family)